MRQDPTPEGTTHQLSKILGVIEKFEKVDPKEIPGLLTKILDEVKKLVTGKTPQALDKKATDAAAEFVKLAKQLALKK